MRYRLLGPVAVEGDDGTAVVIPAPKRRALLAALLLSANRPVSTDELVAALWGENPPPAATGSLHAHVSRLRAELGHAVVETAPPGYRVRVAEGELDLAEFERHAAAGRAALRDGRWATAVEALTEALSLWRGPALADVRDTSPASDRAAALDEARMAVLEERIEAELRLGRAADLVEELAGLTRAHPERERLWQQLMLALYQSGRQADALAAYRTLRDHLVEELGIDPSPESQELEARLLRQDPSLAGPGAGSVQPSVRLPAWTSEVIGREGELVEIRERITEGDSLLTLVGPGGVGKTRLAIEAAHQLVGEYPDGVIFVDLSAIRDPMLVMSTVGQEIGGGERPWELILDRRMLLVLDNFEQVLEAAPAVATLLQRCVRLRLLVTSRAPLRIRRERVMEVAPLQAAEASRLFQIRAREALARWSADPRTTEGIVARLDGLPLAIELTAARVGGLAPAALQAALEHPLEVAARGPRDAPRRHQALRDAIGWSYELLSPGARRTLRGLAAFAGGCDLEAAKDVANATVDTISELVDHSLVRRDGDRYRLLDTIREFAADEAAAAGEEADDRDRHLAFFVQRMAGIGRLTDGPDGRNAWMATSRRERDNLRLAFDRAVAIGDATAIRSLNRSVGIFWLMVGAMAEGERWGTAALEILEPSQLRERAHTIAHLAEYPRWSGDHERAIAMRLDGIAAARGTEDIEILATLLDDLSWSLGAVGRVDDAVAAIREARELRDQMPDDSHGLAHTLAAEAYLYLRLGRPDGAMSLVRAVRSSELEQVLPPVWTIENDGLEARVLMELGRPGEAAALYARALRASVDEDFRPGLLDALEGLAQLAATEEVPERAARLIGMADRVRAESGLAGYDPAAFVALVEDVRGRCGADLFAQHRSDGHALPIPAMPAILDE